MLGGARDARDALVVGGLGEGVVTERAAEQPLALDAASVALGGVRQNVRERACGAAAGMRVGTGLRASATSTRRR